VSPTQSAADDLRVQETTTTEVPTAECRETIGVTVTKRKYRRHPKVYPHLRQSWDLQKRWSSADCVTSRMKMRRSAPPRPMCSFPIVSRRWSFVPLPSVRRSG
jgi:hypothetical protein